MSVSVAEGSKGSKEMPAVGILCLGEGVRVAVSIGKGRVSSEVGRIAVWREVRRFNTEKIVKGMVGGLAASSAVVRVVDGSRIVAYYPFDDVPNSP